MTDAVSRLVTAWQLAVRSSLAHWKLLSSVVLGVLLASAVMAGTVIYFDALRELALRKTVDSYSITELDVLVKAERGPTNRGEYQIVQSLTESHIDLNIAWMARDRVRGGKTSTFFLATPGNEDAAGDDNARSYFAFLPRLDEYTTLVPGSRLPVDDRLSAPGDPLVIEALVPLDAAQLFGVGIGDKLVAVPHWDDTTPHATVTITGMFTRRDLDAEFWHLERTVLQAATGASFRTVPFFISETAFMDVLGPSFSRMDSTYAWLVSVVPSRINSGNADRAQADLGRMDGQLGSLLSGYRQTTALDNALREYDRRLFFSKLPMFVVLILIAVVVLYYVATLSSLAVEQRRGEVALMRSRGGSSAQILAVFVLEGATIAVIAIVVGPLLAAAAISVVGLTPAFSDLTGNAPLSVTLSRGAYGMSALGGLLAFVALIIPAVQASRIGVTRQRQEAARPTRLPAFQRYYLDVLLLLISILLFRQLTEQGSVLGTKLFGEVLVSQLLLALPGLMLVASAMVLLRLFPLVMSLASRLLSPVLPAGLAVGVWQMARNPTHYARLSLLLILTAGLGIFASSFGATLERSFTERVLYSTGSDVRVDGVRPVGGSRGRFFRRRVVESVDPAIVDAYASVPGVDRVTSVLRATGQDLSKGFGADYVMLSMEAESFGDVAWFRRDFADKPIEGLVEGLQSSADVGGLVMPDDARTIGVKIRPDRPHPSARLIARTRDAQGGYATHFLGTLDSGDWRVYEIGLRERRPETLPLQLVSISIHETGAGRRLRAGSILIDDVRVATAGGETVIVDHFDDPSQWSLLKVSSEAAADVLTTSGEGTNGESSAMFTWSEGSALTNRGIFHGTTRSALPVLASESFMKKTGHSKGEEFEVSVSGHRVPVRVVDTVELFPTMMSLSQSFLVSDLASLIRYANLGSNFRELRPNEMWISTETHGVDRKLLIEQLETDEGLLNSSVHDRETRLEDAQVDPLVKAGWRSLLFIAFAAVLILSCLGFLVHAYVSFRNRELQFALLRTVGFSTRQLIAMVWLEQVLVIGAGMALGTWMGGRLGATIMPFLGHDDFGGQVVPPFVMDVSWGSLLLTYAAMSVVFAAIIVALIWFIRKISLHRIMRIGEM